MERSSASSAAGRRPAPDQQERHGLGSGFLIGDGYVLNNTRRRVQDRGRTSPADGRHQGLDRRDGAGRVREFTAKVRNDPKTDVALLKIEASTSPSFPGSAGRQRRAAGRRLRHCHRRAVRPPGHGHRRDHQRKERALGPGPSTATTCQTDASIQSGQLRGPLQLREVIGIKQRLISGANTIGSAIPIAGW